MAHLDAAEGERLPVARCFQYGYGAQEGAFGLGVLPEGHLCGGHLRKAYAGLGGVAARLVYLVSPEGIVERLLGFIHRNVTLGGHAVLDGHAVGVARLGAVSERLEDVAFAVVELLGHEADAGQRVECTADAPPVALLATEFKALLGMFDGLGVVREAEVEQP